MRWLVLGVAIAAFLALCDGAVVATVLGFGLWWVWLRRQA
jgi:hypothetical protein